MVALYLVETTKYVNEKKVYHYKYLTRENPASKRNVTSWVWNWLGTKKLRDKNWTETKNLGVKGYAFPYGDGDIR